MLGQRSPSKRLSPNSQNVHSSSFMAVNENPNIRTEDCLPGYQMNQFNNISHTLAQNLMVNGQPLQNSFNDILPTTSTTYYNDHTTFISSKLSSTTPLLREKHLCLLFFNLLFYIVVIVGIVLIFVIRIPIWSLAQMVGIPYLLYLIYTLCLNPFKMYLSHMKGYESMEDIYNQLKQRTGHIKLTAECYHYTGGKHKRKVITHSAVQMIPVRQCIDESEPLSNLRNIASYIFCKIQRCYYFGDKNSSAAFQTLLATFQTNNKRDVHQIYTHILDITIPGFCDTIGLCSSGSACHLTPLFVIFTILGLGYPYILVIECLSKRYQINCVKRLTI